MTVRTLACGAAWLLLTLSGGAVAQEQTRRPGLPVPQLGPGPYVFDTAEQHRVQVTVLTRDLSHPWAIAFLPDGSMLVTERPGRLRIIRNGVLDPTPVAGVPPVRAAGLGGLEDIALHPRFAENHFLYLTYIKPVDSNRGTPVETYSMPSRPNAMRLLTADEPTGPGSVTTRSFTSTSAPCSKRPRATTGVPRLLSTGLM